jgi:uncharacterized protein YgiM (DUF1202 family)
MATLRRIGIALALLALLTLAAPTFAQTAFGTVTADQLNVRTLPDPVDGVAFTRVFRGQVYTVIGRDSTANWFQIQLPDGNTGWVSSAYFRVDNFGGVPVTNADYVQGRVLSHLLNLREAPTTNARVLGQISRGQVYRVIGKNADASWYQLRLPSGLTAWVISRSLFVSDPSRVPVVNPGASSQAIPSGGTTGPITGLVVTDQLNVRTLPDPLDGVAFTRVFEGQTYNVIGRDDTTTWFQIQLADGQTGWVSGAYLRVSNPNALPVTFSGYIQGTVANASLLNVRSSPNPYVSNNILGQISRGQTYRVLARSSNNWYEIRLPSGTTGWVNGRYLTVTNPGAVPLR